jgi:hypothetical protein
MPMTTQMGATTGQPTRRNQVGEMNARLQNLPAILSAQNERNFQQRQAEWQESQAAATAAWNEQQQQNFNAQLAQTQSNEAALEAERQRQRAAEEAQQRASLGLEATRMGQNLMNAGGGTINEAGSQISNWFGGGSGGGASAPTISPSMNVFSPATSSTPNAPGGGAPGSSGTNIFTSGGASPAGPASSSSGSSGGGFFSSLGESLGNMSLSSAAGSMLGGYGAAQMFSEESENTRAGWGALFGGLSGLLGGGGLSGAI